jgi:hypothetical protein
MIEADHMVKIIAIESFLLTCYKQKTLFKTSFETSSFFNGFSALERLSMVHKS